MVMFVKATLAIAAAADAKFARLRPTVEPPTAVFDGDLLVAVAAVIDAGVEHSGSLGAGVPVTSGKISELLDGDDG
jgi:hypothetical protein